MPQDRGVVVFRMPTEPVPFDGFLKQRPHALEVGRRKHLGPHPFLFRETDVVARLRMHAGEECLLVLAKVGHEGRARGDVDAFFQGKGKGREVWKTDRLDACKQRSCLPTHRLEKDSKRLGIGLDVVRKKRASTAGDVPLPERQGGLGGLGNADQGAVPSQAEAPHGLSGCLKEFSPRPGLQESSGDGGVGERKRVPLPAVPDFFDFVHTYLTRKKFERHPNPFLGRFHFKTG